MMRSLQTIRSLIRKVRRPVKDAGNLPVAVRPITGLALAPIRRVQRRTLGAAVSAWLAVRTHTPESSYLKARLASCLQSTPRDVTAPIPTTEIDASTGELLISYGAGDSRHPSDRTEVTPADIVELRSPIAAEAAFQRNATQASGDASARELDELEGDRRMTERDLLDKDEHLEGLDREQNQTAAARTRAVEAGEVELASPVNVPSRSTIIWLRAAEIATIASESYCTFAALTNTAGIDPSNLGGEFRRDPLTVAGWMFASTVISAVLFFVTEWAFGSIRRVLEELHGRNRTVRLVTASAALLVVFVAIVGFAALRAELSSAGHASIMTTAFYAVLGLLLILGGALLHLRADVLSAERRAALRAAAVPDPAAAAVLLRSAHKEALIAERDRLRARRDEIMKKIQTLHASMHGTEQLVRDVARHETRVVEVWLDSLRAALAADKLLFERFARAQGRTSLLVPAEQPAPITMAVVPLRKRSAS